MKIPFRQKLKSKEQMKEFKKKTLQDVQLQVNNALLELGDLTYYRGIKQSEVDALATKVDAKKQSIDKLIKEFNDMKDLAKAEMEEVIAEGDADEAAATKA